MNKNIGRMFCVDKDKTDLFFSVQKNEKLRNRADTIISKIDNIFTNTERINNGLNE